MLQWRSSKGKERLEENRPNKDTNKSGRLLANQI